MNWLAHKKKLRRVSEFTISQPLLFTLHEKEQKRGEIFILINSILLVQAI